MHKKILLTLLSVMSLSACGMETDLKQQSASRIARPAFMIERNIQAGMFSLQAWERMHKRNTTATIYIEGDSINQVDTKAGLISSNLPGINSTPAMPLGLYLASRDKSSNLAYLARPCQYIKMPEEKGCASAYWQEKRFTPEVMSSYEKALDDIKARYDVTGFHIVGYDGGANIAAVLAAKRTDILSLRTVAGNLNPDFATDHSNHKTLASNSVLAIDYATMLTNVPQHHFIGAADGVITPGIYHSYRQMLGLSECVSYSLVQDADHSRGWVEKWPELLSVQPQCAVVHNDDLPALNPAPIDFPSSDYRKGITKFSK
jgi:hypothetical protein